jgi:DNA gyrase subunit B
MTSNAEVYSSESIVVLSALEAVRRRPGMYIGDVRDGSGLHHMLWEVVANALDEHIAGRAKRIRISIEGQLAEVEDDGRGFPIAPHPKLGMPFVELALTQLHMGRPTLDGHLPHMHVGLMGVGIAVVNALSEELEIEVRRDGWSWHQRFARGVPLGPLERGARTTRTGTRLRFRADASIFEESTFDRDVIRDRLQELAAFNPNLTFELMAEEIREPRGLIGLLEELAGDHIADTFTMRSLQDDVLVEVALGRGSRAHSLMRSFVGQSETNDGGTHESGFWRGMAAAIAAANPAHTGRLPRGAFRTRRRLAGLHAIVHVDLRHPRFGGPTRSRLESREVEAIVQQRVEDAYGQHLREHPELALALLGDLSGASRRND